MRQRLTATPHATMIAAVHAPGIARDLATVWPFMLRSHLAHAVMLRDRAIVPAAAAHRLVAGLRALSPMGPEELAVDETLEDVYFNVERHLEGRWGETVSGWLQTGRSRNDHYACVARMWTRAEVVAVAEQALALRSLLLVRAAEHAETVMTGYTHQQPAQPVTLGHYLLGVEASLARDVARLVDAWPRLNLCPLGAGSMAGVSWPVDRAYLAALLGFDGVCASSIDAVATRDFAYEVVAALALLTTTISRFAADLQQFATWEFGGIEVADDVAAVSSIMPQKKNPVSLEHCKGACAQVVGAWVAMVTSAKAAPFSHQRETSLESMRPFLEAVTQTNKSVALMIATVSGLIVRREHLAARAGANFSTATDLADALVRHCGLTFRQAHAVVGSGVRLAIESSEGPGWFTADRLAELIEAQTGRREVVGLEGALSNLDARASVESRVVAGGPAPSAVRAQLAAGNDRLERDRAWFADRLEGLQAAERDLRARAEQQPDMEGENA